MAFEIEFDPDALKELKKLDRPAQQRLVGFLKQRVATLDNPREIARSTGGCEVGQLLEISGRRLAHHLRHRRSPHRCSCSAHRQSARGLPVVRLLRTQHPLHAPSAPTARKHPRSGRCHPRPDSCPTAPRSSPAARGRGSPGGVWSPAG